MTTNDSSRGTRLLPRRVENVHFRGFTTNRPTPQDNQPQFTLAANSDSLWIFPHLTQVNTGGVNRLTPRNQTGPTPALLPAHGLDDSGQAQR